MAKKKRFAALGCSIVALAMSSIVACSADAGPDPVTGTPPGTGWSVSTPHHAGVEPVAGYAAGTFPSPVGWEAPGRREQWGLVWNDEFSGNSLNPDRWNMDTGTGAQFGLTGWGNAELQYYRRSNVMVRNGHLILEARDDGRGAMNFTSGKITSGGTRASATYLSETFPERFAIQEGFIEARIRSPRGAGFWPAFWTLGTNVNQFGNGGLEAYRNWPYSGEIDIMEIRGHEAGFHMAGNPPQLTGPRFMSTIHHGLSYPAARWFPGASMWFDGREQPIAAGQAHIDAGRVIRRTPVVLPPGVDLANGFHVYGVRWDGNYMDFYFNGVNWMTIDLRNLQGGDYANAAAFTAPTGQFINLNLAVGGNFLPAAYREPNPALFAPGSPWETRSLTIDWVRVHERVR